MPSLKTPSSGVLGAAFRLAKKMAQTGVDSIAQLSPTVTPLDRAPEQKQVIEGQSNKAYSFEKKHYEYPQVVIREHLPRVSSQLLGRHYTHLSRISHKLAPELNHKVADYFFDYLNTWVSEQTSVQAVLDEVGVKNLAELAQDSARSGRISQALSNQNKIIAATLSAFTGVTGVVGAAVDVPVSLMLALRSIYQTGRAYGFELNPEDHGVIEYIFKQVDLGSVTEKQAILAALRAFNQMLSHHDLNQLQQLLGSSNDIALLKKCLSLVGLEKWPKANLLLESNSVAYLAKFTPFVGMGVSAAYSCHLVENATEQAQHFFAQARHYLQAHPEQGLDPLEAYLLQQQTPVQVLNSQLLDHVDDLTTTVAEQSLDVATATAQASQLPDAKTADESHATPAVNSNTTETSEVKTVATKRSSSTASQTRNRKSGTVRNTTKAEQSAQTPVNKRAKSSNKSQANTTTTATKAPVKKPLSTPKN